MRNLIKEFLDVKTVEEGAALNTLKAYRNDIRQFSEAIAPLLVQNVKTEDIEDYLKKLKDSGCLSKTLSRKISCIREFYKFLQSEKIISKNPASRLRTPKIGKRLPSFLTMKEIKKLCAVAQNEKNFSLIRLKAMVKLMYSSGLRVSELVSLPENAINYDLKQILICGKGSKERIVPVTKEAIEDIFKYVERRDAYMGNQKNKKWLFPSSRSMCGHITRDAFFKSLKKMAIQAGIAPEKVHPHVLRHSFATQLVNNSADLRSIQKMLGHENVVTTEIYTHITTEKLVNEIKKHHPLMQQQNKKDDVNEKS
ncbi:MAG: tyrosine recombinase [Alphaproteobacteria bacterium]|nr:tyrosine recombinase [Alphaproteobacteria bacterium]